MTKKFDIILFDFLLKLFVTFSIRKIFGNSYSPIEYSIEKSIYFLQKNILLIFELLSIKSAQHLIQTKLFFWYILI